MEEIKSQETKFQEKKAQEIMSQENKFPTSTEITRKTVNTVRRKYYCLYEKLDKMEHKPRLRYTIEEAKETYKLAQKLADFMKIAVEKLEAYNNKEE